MQGHHAVNGGKAWLGFWDNSKCDMLEAMWLRGEPTADIAEAVGSTRCGVIGKANRMGLPAHPNATLKTKGTAV